jgi:hypothetical protein
VVEDPAPQEFTMITQNSWQRRSRIGWKFASPYRIRLTKTTVGSPLLCA